jgi:ribosomal protein S12 methylthiotransferase accessory factor
MRRQVSQIEDLMPLVDGAVGIIRSLQRISRGDDEPEPPILYRAILSNFDFRPGQPFDREAAGKGLTDAAAMGGAIGEAIERYCAAHTGLAQSQRGSINDLHDPILSPAACVLYSEEQYSSGSVPFMRFANDIPINWTLGVELPEGNSVWLPELLTYLNTNGLSPNEYFCPPSSNGLAAGPDLDSAILAGLCELAERDAFFITWLNRLPVDHIDVGTRGPVAAICQHYRQFGLVTTMVALATDLPVHAVLALAIDRDRPPACVVGFGCDLDPARAALKALFEISQLRPAVVRHVASGSGFPTEYSDVRTMQDHSTFFADPAKLKEMEFLLTPRRVIPMAGLVNHSTGSTASNLALCVSALRAAGCRVTYADLTTPDVAPFPIRVVRTIATGLQPIHFGFSMERLGGRRLFELPCKLKYAESIRDESELNRCPHPMA